MKDTGFIEREEENNKKVVYRVLKYDGTMEMNNVFISRSSMVVLQLEIKVGFITSSSKVDKDFIVGFLPIYICDKFGI